MPRAGPIALGLGDRFAQVALLLVQLGESFPVGGATLAVASFADPTGHDALLSLDLPEGRLGCLGLCDERARRAGPRRLQSVDDGHVVPPQDPSVPGRYGQKRRGLEGEEDPISHDHRARIGPRSERGAP
jgi:hypothetical protein